MRTVFIVVSQVLFIVLLQCIIANTQDHVNPEEHSDADGETKSYSYELINDDSANAEDALDIPTEMPESFAATPATELSYNEDPYPSPNIVYTTEIPEGRSNEEFPNVDELVRENDYLKNQDVISSTTESQIDKRLLDDNDILDEAYAHKKRKYPKNEAVDTERQNSEGNDVIFSTTETVNRDEISENEKIGNCDEVSGEPEYSNCNGFKIPRKRSNRENQDSSEPSKVIESVAEKASLEKHDQIYSLPDSSNAMEIEREEKIENEYTMPYMAEAHNAVESFGENLRRQLSEARRSLKTLEKLKLYNTINNNNHDEFPRTTVMSSGNDYLEQDVPNKESSKEKIEREKTELSKENELKEKAMETTPYTSTTKSRSKTTLINYPYTVSVQRKGSHYASGALIDRRWILSSAGEFYNIRESIKLFRARLGSVSCKRGGLLVPLQDIEIHPSYVYGQPNFDLSLLKLAHAVKFTDYIRPIILSRTRNKLIGGRFMATYWPRVIVRGQPLPQTAKERRKFNSMRVSSQSIVPRRKCLMFMNSLPNVYLHESTYCLKPYSTHHSPCLPDAGAPLVGDDGLWGVTSGWMSQNCLSNPSPNVFTRLSSLVVRAWMRTQIRNS